jgi:hypothetical protein
MEILHSQGFIQAYGYLLSVMTIISFWLLGGKKIAGWWVSVANCFLWTLYSYMTGQWGLFPGTVFILAMDIRGIYNWRHNANIG